MTSYIVRIYRRGDSEEDVVGTVAVPGRERREPFRSFRELMAILRQGDSDEAPPTSSKGCSNEGK